MKIITLLAALACAAPIAAQADDMKSKEQAKTEPLNASDAQIVAKLHHANEAEIDMASFALAHGTKVVSTFAKTLIRDHVAADKDLGVLAKRHGLSPIPKPIDLDTNEMDGIAHLKSLTGAKLDREFVDLMLSDHRDALNMIDTATASVTDPDLHALLATTRPVIQRHFDTAQDMQVRAQARR